MQHAPHRISAALVAAGGCVLVLASCGGGGAESPLDDALGYLPADTPLAVAISTDLDSDAYQDLDLALQRFGVEGGLDAPLEDLGDYAGISFSRDVRPLLGNELVVGGESLATALGEEGEDERVVAAIRVSDGDDARDLLGEVGLEEQDEVEGATVYGEAPPEEVPEGVEPESIEATGPGIAVDGDMVIAAESRLGLEEALRQREEDDRLTEEAFLDRLGDLPSDGLVRASGDVPSALEALGVEQVSGVPWIEALQSFGMVADVSDRTLTVDAAVTGEKVSEQDLPLAAGPDSPAVLENRPSVATRDQAQTLDFALEVVKASVPQAAFEEVTGRLEKQLDGSISSLASQFGEGLVAEIEVGKGEERQLEQDQSVSRTELRDPVAVSKAVGALRGEVQRLAQFAQEGGPVAEALDAARFVIPALPLPEEGFFPASSKVKPVSGEPGLYSLLAPKPSRLHRDIPRPEFVFGVVDGIFVTAPSLEAARQAANMRTVAHRGPPGSLAASAPLEASDLGLPAAPGADVTVTTIEAGIEASTGGLRLRAEAGL